MSEPKFVKTVLEDGTEVVTLVKGDKAEKPKESKKDDSHKEPSDAK